MRWARYARGGTRSPASRELPLQRGAKGFSLELTLRKGAKGTTWQLPLWGSSFNRLETLEVWLSLFGEGSGAFFCILGGAGDDHGVVGHFEGLVQAGLG